MLKFCQKRKCNNVYGYGVALSDIIKYMYYVLGIGLIMFICVVDGRLWLIFEFEFILIVIIKYHVLYLYIQRSR